MSHQIGDERWAQSGACANTREDPTVGDAAFANRNPASDELVGGWINHGFTGARGT